MRIPVLRNICRCVKPLQLSAPCKRWISIASTSPSILQNGLQSQQRQQWRCHATANGGFLAQHLEERTLLRISGEDASDFMQGLVSNDMGCLDFSREDCGGTLYSFLLNVQGRVLYDMILYAVMKRKKNPDDFQGPSLLLECTKDIAVDLLKIIKRYKIRKKIALESVGEEYKIWAVFPRSSSIGETPPGIDDSSNVVMYEPDPRLKALGHRLILPAQVDVSSVLPGVEEVKADDYKVHRYKLGVAEGSTELPAGSCLPLESNAVFLNGVSFNKGCYIGQELTARTYHTGLTRKRIMPLLLDSEIPTGLSTVHNTSDKKCGVVRGSADRYAIGLMRIPDTVGKGPLTVKNEEGEVLTTAKVMLPNWWQTDADQILKQVMTDFPDEFSSASQ